MSWKKVVLLALAAGALLACGLYARGWWFSKTSEETKAAVQRLEEQQKKTQEQERKLDEVIQAIQNDRPTREVIVKEVEKVRAKAVEQALALPAPDAVRRLNERIRSVGGAANPTPGGL